MIAGRPMSAIALRASSSDVGDARSRHVEADLDHRLLEPLAILGGGDRLGVGADHLGRARYADAPLAVQRHGDVQPGLATERREHRVGPLTIDDRRQHFRRERLDVGAIGEVGVGHDRRRVRVGEDDAVALLTKDATGLRAGVVELARLADDDRSRADDEDRRDVVAARHQRRPVRLRAARPALARRRGPTDDGERAAAPRRHRLGEAVEQVPAVVGAGPGLGVVLHARTRSPPWLADPRRHRR